MAERRMFAKSITDADAFTDMPSTAQCLYFHLNQGADDDGFNNQVNHAMANAHASADDLLLLLVKNFVIRFDSGVIVIKHWRIHNTIRMDRYKPTNFQEEMKMLGIKENKSYTMDHIPVGDNQVETKWQPDGNQTETQVRIGKVRLDKDNISPSPESETAADPDIETPPKQAKILSAKQERRFAAFWEHYPKKVGKQDAQRAWKRIDPDDELTDRILHAVEEAKQKDSRFLEERYTPHPASWLNAGSWDDEFGNGYQRDTESSFDVDEFAAAAERNRLP